MNADVTTMVGRQERARWNRVSVGDVFERIRWIDPNRLAIVGVGAAAAYPEHRRLSYASADDLANRMAHALLREGLRAGERVVMLCENSVEAVIAKVAIAKAGLVAVPLNPAMAPNVLEHVLGRTTPSFFIADAAHLPGAVDLLDASTCRGGVQIPIPEIAPGVPELADWLSDAPASEPEALIDGNDIWQLLHTSGTTSMPRAAMLSHTQQYLASYSFALTSTRGLEIESDLVMTNFLPIIYHAGDVTVTQVFLSGGRLVLGRRHDPQEVARAVIDEGATCLFAGSSAMLAAVVEQLDATTEPTALTVVYFGWSPLPRAVYERARARMPGVGLYEIMGMTESISSHRYPIHRNEAAYATYAESRNYVGQPSPIAAARIVDPETDEIVTEPDTPGELQLRSPAMMSGYFGDPDATREATAPGWLRTGDIVAADADGQRYMLDRAKDIVKTGGETVSSIRVEMALLTHPQIVAAAVVGLPDARWGEAVTAFVICDQTLPDPDELREFLRPKLAGFEIPKRFIRLDSFPSGVGGKVQKFELRKRYGTTDPAA